MTDAVALAPDVARALAEGRPVAALETAILTHGLPRPHNLEAVLGMEEAVRAEGAVPATIGILDGRARIGLGANELERLACRPDARKCSTRDLALALAEGAAGGTTVAATLHLARLRGIRFLATGGIGGVHPGGERSLDVSADLHALARCPLTVVCSGPKAILDLPRTFEVLESLGVPVFGWRTAELPGFYVRKTGLPVPSLADEAAFVRVWRAHRRLGEPTALVVAQPPPARLALAPETLAALLDEARAEARRAGVAGPAETPFLLARIAETSGGATVELNVALAVANAGLAGRLAAAVAWDAVPATKD